MCGEEFPSCGPGDPEGGYGNGYNEYLDWYGIVPNSLGATQVAQRGIGLALPAARGIPDRLSMANDEESGHAETVSRSPAPTGSPARRAIAPSRN